MPFRNIVVPVTFTLDTSAYTAGDLLADTQAITAAVPVSAGVVTLTSMVLNDKDDQVAATMTVVFLDANVSLGSENSAPSITDANADAIVGIVPIAIADWVDMGGCKVASKTNIQLMVKGATGSQDIYVALITGGTPTQTASGITGRFAFDRRNT